MTVKVVTGDCLEVLRGMADESVHLVVTSPPYDDLRAYRGYSWDFLGVVEQLRRVLCDGGVICWNVGDSTVDGSESLTSFRHAQGFKHAGFRMHDTMIYEKVNFSRPETVRYHQMFEYIFIVSKGAPRVFNPIKDKPNAYAGATTFGKNTMRQYDGSMKERPKNVVAEFGMRGNVWRGNTAGQEFCGQSLPHPAMMPGWLARDLIRSWSNEGDMVIDPFCGSGTTPLEADRLHRHAIGIEIDPDYAAAARQRIQNDSPLFTEVA